MGPQELRLRLAAILAADAVAYSRLISVDDRGTIEALEIARKTFKTISVANGGRVVDTAGDSVLAIFKTAAGATAAALAIQHELETRADAVPEDRRLRFRLGLHLGDVVQKADGSVYGDGVNVAARRQSAAAAGGIVASESVRLAVRGRVAASFEDLGDHSLKNIAEPVRAHRLTAAGLGPNVQRLPAGSSVTKPAMVAVASRKTRRLVHVGGRRGVGDGARRIFRPHRGGPRHPMRRPLRIRHRHRSPSWSCRSPIRPETRKRRISLTP